ncbi:MAG: D-aminoacyl-tRNA deacylase [Nanoarchaeota archaeon]|nr:D-aminoacyl-tRNA deacylase [Nanoarchaeota archaeon]
MKPIIVASKKDKAGMNIVENLKKLGCKIPIYLIDKEIINAENIDKELDADFIVFASKHQSEKEVSTLTVHPIGNWGEANFGGISNKISLSNPLLLKHFFQTLFQNTKSLDYKISLEATHHGPFIKTPSLFIEIGSTEKQWEDKTAGKIIAQTIIKSVASFKEQNLKIAIGVGGPHYCPNFNQIQLQDKYAISHIIAEYVLPLNEKMIEEAIAKTVGKVDSFILDWKGMGNSEKRNKSLEILKKFNLEIIRTKDAKC